MLRIFILILSIIFINACSDLPEKSLPYWKESNSGMEFVLIPKGSFLMGNHDGKNDVLLKETLHEVTISKDFWLARTEVTQEQWHRIMGKEEIHPEKPSPFRNLNPQYPVVSVSYFDAQRFLKKLNELSNLNHFRLPTEAEWEYACRAGTITHFSF